MPETLPETARASNTNADALAERLNAGLETPLFAVACEGGYLYVQLLYSLALPESCPESLAEEFEGLARLVRAANSGGIGGNPCRVISGTR